MDLARDILIRDFDHFCDRRSFDQDESTEVNRYAANMLLTLKGDKWRRVRNIMSPAFTSGKLKAMVPFIQKVLWRLSLTTTTITMSTFAGWK